MTKNTQGLATHTDSDPSDIQIAKHRIRTIIERRSGDSDSEITSGMLARQVPVSQSTVKDIIQMLIDEGLPIVSGPTGYRLIESRGELDAEIEKINDEIATKEKTKIRLTKAFNQRYYNNE